MVDVTKYPGLVEEALPGGGARYRVRVSGDKGKRITMPCGPSHPEFDEHYHAARAGVKLDTPYPPLVDIAPDAIDDHIRRILKMAKERAAIAGIEFDLHPLTVRGMLESQGRRCAISGVRFDIAPVSKGRRPWAFSLDRIDNSQGYSVENVRLVCTIVNIARSNWSDDDFITMCREVMRHQRRSSRK